MSDPLADPLLLLLHVELQHELGIMPMLDVDTTMRNHIDRLNEEEARRLKRRFRKLWRAHAKKLVRRSSDSYARRVFGLGEQNPTPVQMTSRRRAIYFSLLSECQRKRATLP